MFVSVYAPFKGFSWPLLSYYEGSFNQVGIKMLVNCSHSSYFCTLACCITLLRQLLNSEMFCSLCSGAKNKANLVLCNFSSGPKLM